MCFQIFVLKTKYLWNRRQTRFSVERLLTFLQETRVVRNSSSWSLLFPVHAPISSDRKLHQRWPLNRRLRKLSDTDSDFFIYLVCPGSNYEKARMDGKNVHKVPLKSWLFFTSKTMKLQIVSIFRRHTILSMKNISKFRFRNYYCFRKSIILFFHSILQYVHRRIRTSQNKMPQWREA